MILANTVYIRDRIRFNCENEHREMRQIVSILINGLHEIKLENMTRGMVNELTNTIDSHALSNMLKGLGSFKYIP